MDLFERHKITFFFESYQTLIKRKCLRVQPMTNRTFFLIVLPFAFYTPNSFFTVQRKFEMETRDNICFLHCLYTDLLTPRYTSPFLTCYFSPYSSLPSDDAKMKMAFSIQPSYSVARNTE